MGFFRKLTRDAGHAAAGRTEEAVARAGDKARASLRNLKRIGRRDFGCSCGCGKRWSDYRLWNAHFLAKNGGYWASRAGKAMGRKIPTDKIRRAARSGREAFGHVNRKGVLTDKGRARPATPERTHLTRSSMRHTARADKHDGKAAAARDKGKPGKAARHDGKAAAARNIGRSKAHATAAKHDVKATRARGRGRTDRADGHEARAANLRARHQPRSAPAPRATSNGSRPGPARPAPTGRLAPQSRANGHDSRPAPARTR